MVCNFDCSLVNPDDDCCKSTLGTRQTPYPVITAPSGVTPADSPLYWWLQACTDKAHAGPRLSFDSGRIIPSCVTICESHVCICDNLGQPSLHAWGLHLFRPVIVIPINVQKLTILQVKLLLYLLFGLISWKLICM